ncbi:MAG: hypothetical protein ABIF71_15030 [Planctomycetota bacterium]
MGLISNFRLKMELKKLEGLRESAPTAAIMARLAEIYAEIENNLPKGVKTASEGLRLFPQDAKIKETFQKFSTVLIKREIAETEKKILNFPSASHFVKLCEKYFQIGDFDKAEFYAKSCVKEYPDKSMAYIVLGRVFRHRNWMPQALQMYEKACMLDRYNYDALMEYGALLEKSNDLAKALSIFKSVLFFAPADAQATARIKFLMGKVADAPAAPRSEILDLVSRKDEIPFNIDFGDEHVPAAAAPAAAAPPAPRPAPVAPPAALPAAAPAARSKSGGDLIELLREFRGIEGVLGSILIDNYGLIIAEDVEGAIDSDLLAAVLTNMLRTIKQHAAPSVFGDFRDGFVETDSINFHLYNIKDIELVVFSNAATRLGLLEMKVKSFLDKFLAVEAGL